jgi:transcription antitermination factor NusG
MGAAWYVLHTKPHSEDLLWTQLVARGIETFYPCLHVRPVNPRSRKVRPYFPGYLFARLDLAQTALSELQWLPGLSRLVSFDGEPARVPDGLLQAIARRVDEINAAGGEAMAGLRPGDRVEVTAGPFQGYEAVFDARLPGAERVRVLLGLLRSRQVPVELPAGMVKRKDRR